MCKELKYPHPDYLLEDLTAAQLAEWEAYDKLDPIGTWRDDFRLAYLSSVVTNLVLKVHGKKGVEMTKPQDFMIDWDVTNPHKNNKHTTKQTTEQMKDILLSFVRVHNKAKGNRK